MDSAISGGLVKRIRTKSIIRGTPPHKFLTMAKKATQPQEAKAPKRAQLTIKTLQIKDGDWINTSKGWKQSVSDAYRNNDGIICVEIADWGEYKFMSNDQSITIER